MMLTTADRPPVMTTNPRGGSAFLLIGDHAGRAVPTRLGSLGLTDAELSRHIGWDIGIAALGARLSAMLDAVFVEQVYSRLVVDCNRSPAAPDAIAPVSDGTVVPGNQAVDDAERAARFAEIHEPYQQAIANEIARRAAAGRESVLVALHSFTPVMQGDARPWQIGVLHDRGETDFARAFLAALRADGTLVVGDNAPYRMDLIDYTVPRHALPAALRYVEIEIRQDLIADDAGVERWAAIVAAALAAAARTVG